MSAFLIATVTVKNQEKLMEYSQKAGPTFTPYNGTLITKGNAHKALSGNKATHQKVAIFEFPDMDSLENWYNSNEYQAIIPLREEAADMNIITYEAPPS